MNFDDGATTKLSNLLLDKITLPFKKLHPDAKLPAKAGPLEACYDICCVEDENFIQFDSNKAYNRI